MQKLLGLLLLCLVGCGGSISAPPPPAPDDALSQLQTALNAWKNGTTSDLATATPALRFVDPDQAAGLKLTSYTLVEDPKITHNVVDFPVELTLLDKKKKMRTVQAVYQIVSEPSPAVLRNDP